MFRASLFDRKFTRWRETRQEVQDDILARGWGSRTNEPDAQLYYDVGVKIVERPDAKKAREPKPPRPSAR